MNSQEIIEFPIVVVDVKRREIKTTFQTYVKPTIDPQLTEFCTELTGITQEQVDQGVTIQDAMRQVHMFLGKAGLFSSEFIFMSCGDFDGNHLLKEAKEKEFFVPNYFKRWINIKKAFPIHKFDASKQPYDFTNMNTIHRCKPTVRGMPQMLSQCGLELEGRHHSGIDDAKNLARVAINLMEDGYQFTQGMVKVT